MVLEAFSHLDTNNLLEDLEQHVVGVVSAQLSFVVLEVVVHAVSQSSEQHEQLV